MNRWPLRLSTAVGAVMVLWGALIGALPLRDNSFITHLATGRLLLEGEFPRSDPYSFTAQGEPWVVQSWLASFMFSGAERLAGAGGIQVLVIMVAAALAGSVWLLTSSAGSLTARVGLSSLVLLTGIAYWSARPLLFGLLGIAIVLLVLEARLPVWILLPTFWLWANMHGSYPLGLLLIATVLLGARLDGAPQRQERQVVLAGLAGLLVAIVSPLGLDVWRFPVASLGRVDLLQNIVEWRSPDFTSIGMRAFLIQVLVAVAVLVRHPRYRAALPLCVFVAAALLGARNVPVASLVLVPGTALGLAGLGTLDGRRRSAAASVLASGCVALLLVLSISVARSDHVWSWRGYPLASLAWIEEQGLRGPDSHLMAREYVGNLLTGIHGTDARVFIDDRYDMYPRPVVEDFVGLIEASADWEEILDRYSIDVVLWERDQPLAQVLTASSAWVTVYHDEDTMVTTRRG